MKLIDTTEEYFEYLNINHGVTFLEFIEHQIRLINMFNLFRQFEIDSKQKSITPEVLDNFFNISIELFNLVLKRIKNNE